MLLYLDGFTDPPPTLNVSDDDTFNRTMTIVKDSLNNNQRDELVDAVKLITYSDRDLVRVLSGIGLHVQANVGRRKLHGLTAEQTIEVAECIRNKGQACREPSYGYADWASVGPAHPILY
jgi:hypothetical protein